MDNAARTRQRVLAVFLPIAAVLYISAEALSPKGTDQVATDTATALKLLAIAAKHPPSRGHASHERVFRAAHPLCSKDRPRAARFTCARLGTAGASKLVSRASKLALTSSTMRLPGILSLACGAVTTPLCPRVAPLSSCRVVPAARTVPPPARLRSCLDNGASYSLPSALPFPRFQPFWCISLASEPVVLWITRQGRCVSTDLEIFESRVHAAKNAGIIHRGYRRHV
jgi:hypothetical protein